MHSKPNCCDFRDGTSPQANSADERTSLVRNLIVQRLPAADRLLLVLAYAEGMTIEDIAQAVDDSPAGIREKLARIERAMRVVLRAEGEAVSEYGPARLASAA